MRQASINTVFPLLFLLLASGPAFTQAKSHTTPLVKVTTTVDKQKILIGQPIQLMLEATVQNNAPLTWPALDSLPHFDWLEKGKVDSVVHPDGRSYRQYLTITSFDSGSWTLPPLSFISGNKKYFSDTVRIEVGYTKIDPKQDYHDIKDIVDIPNAFAKWIGWIVAISTLLFTALAVWLIRKKKVLKIFRPAAPVPVVSPYEEAIRQLEEIEQQQLAASSSVKLFYTKLNDILRLFVLRRLGITSLSETNEELIRELGRLSMSQQQFNELSDTLRMSDFVKFAKYQPGIAENKESLKVIRSSVEALNNVADSYQLSAKS